MTPPVLRPLTVVAAACLVLACSDSPVSPDETRSAAWTLNAPSAHRPHGVVFVTSLGLFFDACAEPVPLPMHGEFQLIFNGRTEFGPGQLGFLNGRWWEDLNRNGVRDTADHFFFCPLALPGRVTP
jgi:hypothetical protein